ncbi:hypothetical protein JT05_03150 [Desulfosporosinus sp. Tol-M]|nr:hypothetical protein JT05_03150 [Desulfosporosinus sp. Tol-M]
MNHEHLENVLRFHGHLCPGVAFGYRAGLYALKEFGAAQGTLRDTHIVIAENEVCGLDGIQIMTGCTVGNDGLLIQNIGKQAFIIIAKKDGHGLRVLLDVPLWDSEHPLMLHAKVKSKTATPEEKKEFFALRTKRGQEILSMTDDELLKVFTASYPYTEKIRLFPFKTCDQCGEAVMSPLIKEVKGKYLCQSCEK